MWRYFLISGAFAGALCGQSFSDRNARYQLQPEDKIEVQYRYTPEYNAQVSIQPDGFVSLPLTGDVKVAGMTLDQASQAIAKKAGERLAAPEVSVLLREYVKPYFVVAGEVAHPGRFDLRGNVSVVEAIAQSGGFKETSKHTQVVLLHKVDPDHAEVKLLDMNHLMSAAGVREDPDIRSGDMLIVPRNFISKIEPIVRISSNAVTSILFGIK
jgi:polysaccharide export outer membrane protein